MRCWFGCRGFCRLFIGRDDRIQADVLGEHFRVFFVFVAGGAFALWQRCRQTGRDGAELDEAVSAVLAASFKRPLFNQGDEQRTTFQRELGQFVEAVGKSRQECGNLLWRQLFNIFRCGFIGLVCLLGCCLFFFAAAYLAASALVLALAFAAALICA